MAILLLQCTLEASFLALQCDDIKMKYCAQKVSLISVNANVL